ncbi:uncharacterized protein LOC141787979 [Halichoeres trimaculatus]|uniref:uncharacterized protein LOC141787979 n=1 Tax=Halichoeres trimaculatus TaxID=147232 RepID=UPI003D9E8CDF
MDHSQQLQVHVSIQKSLSFPTVQKCINCCTPSRYHCPFCSPALFKPSKYSKISEHLTLHFRTAVFAGEYTIHKCGLGCRSQTHFHCLFCSQTLIRRIDFKKHIQSCRNAKQSSAQTLSVNGRTERPMAPLLIPQRDEIPSFNMESNIDFKDMNWGSDNHSSHSATTSDCDETFGSGSSKCDQIVQTDLDKPQDCDEFYFMYLVKIFKKLSPEKKARVRMKIERLLFEAEFE